MIELTIKIKDRVMQSSFPLFMIILHSLGGIFMHFKSIKTQLIIICILFAIVPLLIVSILSSEVSKKALRNTSNQLTVQIMGQAGINVTHYIEETEKSLNKFVVSDLIQSNLLSDFYSSDAIKKLNAEKKINEKIIYTESLDSSFTNISLVFPDSQILGNGTALLEDNLLKVNSMELQEECIWNHNLESDTKNIYIIQGLSFLANNQKQTCILVVQLNIDELKTILDEIELLDSSLLSLVVDTEHNIYATNEDVDSLLDLVWDKINYEETLNTFSSNNNMFTYYNLPNGWKLVSQIPLRSLTKQLDTATLLIWTLLIIVFFLAIIVGKYVSKTFANPIISLMHLMKKAEDGDMTIRAKVKGSNEITKLCISFNHMFENICALLKETKGVIDHTLDDTLQLSTSTQKSVVAFEQLSLSIDEIAEGAVCQADYANESSQAMSALSEAIGKVLTTIHDIYQNNQGAKNLIQTANLTMDSLNSSMSSSLKTANHIKESMNELNILNKNVEALMKLLDDIGEQTNLLSLNASIEAARAGAAGKGFAVVAEEIRALSEQSKHSTQIVRNNLLKMEQKTEDTFHLIHESNETFATQETAVKEANKIFEQIVHTLLSTDTNLGEVKSQIQDMQSVKEITTEKIVNIAAVTQESAAATEQVSALNNEQQNVIEQLSLLSNQLTDSMNALNSSIQTFIL